MKKLENEKIKVSKSTKLKKDKSTIIFNIVGYFIVVIFSLFCVIPFIIMVSGSISNEQEIVKHGYSILPRGFSLEAYKTIFKYPDQIIRAYGVTTAVTVIGTVLGLLLTSMAGYVLARKDFKSRNTISFLIYFTTLFGGGLVPWYLVLTQILHLKNSYWGLIIPGLLTPFLIFLFKNFLSSVPDSLIESARIDGANDFYIYWKIVLPLAKPALATIGLFTALSYWNNWFYTSILITDTKKYSLQYLLYNILQNSQFMQQQSLAGAASVVNPPTETVKLATAIIVTGPVILFYPFAQKYFVEGLTIGGVKG
ncbi:carbohydrate ABC transporter permease [Clostridium felsineum]|uniref:carbohydrate ABC transporter permease n=1 Tax=Clostridium felsineum TaxID=36839 RepID=UPI00396AA12B